MQKKQNKLVAGISKVKGRRNLNVKQTDVSSKKTKYRVSTYYSKLTADIDMICLN